MGEIIQTDLHTVFFLWRTERQPRAVGASSVFSQASLWPRSHGAPGWAAVTAPQHALVRTALPLRLTRQQSSEHAVFSRNKEPPFEPGPRLRALAPKSSNAARRRPHAAAPHGHSAPARRQFRSCHLKWPPGATSLLSSGSASPAPSSTVHAPRGRPPGRVHAVADGWPPRAPRSRTPRRPRVRRRISLPPFGPQLA